MWRQVCFQFTLRQLLASMFWFSLAFVVISWAVRHWWYRFNYAALSSIDCGMGLMASFLTCICLGLGIAELNQESLVNGSTAGLRLGVIFYLVGPFMFVEIYSLLITFGIINHVN